MDLGKLQKLSKLIRYDILASTTEAGSGHPTSSMSAVELATVLFFGGFFHFDPQNPQNPLNDRFILSKGHASPLLYSLYHAAGWISKEQLMSLRKFESDYEGHPTPRIPYVDVATGSLGQGLSAGVGMALAMRVKRKALNVKRNDEDASRFTFHALPKVFVLLGDSEMAEGQVWEAIEIAGYYKLNNLVAVLDVNRLGQRGETMLAWDLETYARRGESFGWNTIIIEDGHSLEKVYDAYSSVILGSESDSGIDSGQDGSPDGIRQARMTNKPTIIIAKTKKGKGVSFLEDQDNWHGKPVPKEKLEEALKEIGEIDLEVRGEIKKPAMSGVTTARSSQALAGKEMRHDPSQREYQLGDLVATREAYGKALVDLGKTNENIVAFDGEVSNSTYSDKFQKAYPDRFFEMFIAEQNMVTAALGASKLGLIPFASSFAAFLTRSYDQIRMAQYSKPNLKIVGSHAGVSIGQDGPSQMGLEDLSMARSILDSVVFYPADAVSTGKLTEIMADTDGLFYLRTTREKTPVIYNSDETFKIGGSKILFQSDSDSAVVFTAGITLHETVKAYNALKREGINIAVIDLYCTKPLDETTVKKLAQKAKNVIVVEDHYPAGGLGEAVLATIANSNFKISNFKFTHLCVTKLPRSGSPQELLNFEEIDAEAIVKAVKAFK